MGQLLNTRTNPMNPLPSIGDRVRTDSTVALLREPAFALLSRIQDANPSDQVRALFLVAAVISDAIGIDGDADVIIVGAGVAGSALAHTLGKVQLVFIA